MTEQEREQLNRFLKQLLDVQAISKDPEAERLINETVARQPDAAYLLVQRSLLLEQAVNRAQAQIRDLQSQRPATAGGSFLGSDPWRQSPANAVPGAGSYQTPSSAGGFTPSAPSGTPGMASSFLGNIATTAAGVVAGSFLFQGIESLLGHHAAPASPWSNPSDVGHENVTEQTVINNYYGDSDPDAVLTDDQSFLSSDDSNDYFVDDSDNDSNWV